MIRRFRSVVARLGSAPDRATKLVVVLALVVRLLWLWYGHRAAKVGDPAEYVYYGFELARGNGYQSHAAQFTQWPDVPTAFYAVGYPLFLAGLFSLVHLFGFDYPDASLEGRAAVLDALRVYESAAWVYGVAHAILGALTVWFVARIARRLFGPRVAVVAALVVALWPNLVMYTATAHVETLYLFLLTAAVLVLLPTLERDVPIHTGRLVAGGALLGLSAQVRPLVGFLVPAVFVAYRRRPDSWGRALRHALVVVVTMVAVIAPWTVRNAMVMPGFVLVTTGSGDALCMSRYGDAKGDFEVASPGCLNEVPNRPWDEVEVIKNRENTTRAWKWVLENPEQEVRMWFWRGFRAFEGDHEARVALESRDAADFYEDPLFTDRGRDVADLVCDLYYWAVLALAVLGLRRFRRAQHRGAMTMVLGAAIAGAVVPILVFGDARYKLPMHPFVAIIAAVGIVRLLEHRAADREASIEPNRADPSPTPHAGRDTA